MRFSIIMAVLCLTFTGCALQKKNADLQRQVKALRTENEELKPMNVLLEVQNTDFKAENSKLKKLAKKVKTMNAQLKLKYAGLLRLYVMLVHQFARLHYKNKLNEKTIAEYQRVVDRYQKLTQELWRDLRKSVGWNNRIRRKFRSLLRSWKKLKKSVEKMGKTTKTK